MMLLECMKVNSICKPGNRINAKIFNVFRPERRVKLYVYKENFDWLFSCLWGIQRKGVYSICQLPI